MDAQKMNYAYLQLGLTREEFNRRVARKEIDLELLNSQLEHNSRELKLEALSEKWIELKALDQVDKFADQVDKFTDQAE